jgi:hypothetical protein
MVFKQREFHCNSSNFYVPQKMQKTMALSLIVIALKFNIEKKKEKKSPLHIKKRA